MKVRTNPLGFAALAVFALTAPLAGQQPGAAVAGDDPNVVPPGHYHVGELGEKYLLVERSIKCQCGCGLDVHSCQFQMQCEYSPVWSQRIRAALEDGEDIEAIQASFVADFGTQVLMAPPPEGFNLVGYLLPGFAIVTVGMLVGLLARGSATREALAPVGELTDEDAERLRAAMRRLDEEEGPDW